MIVLGFANDDRLAGTEVRQPLQFSLGEVPLARRDRVAVRIFQRLAQVLGEGLLEPGRNGMLQCVGLDVHFAPIEPQHLREK